MKAQKLILNFKNKFMFHVSGLALFLILSFGITNGQDTFSLEEILESLNDGYTSVNSVVPNRFGFNDGVSGYYISDGGNDMYDFGNQLLTNLGGYLYYSDNQIVSSNYLGTNGRYFTRKYPGLFVFAADINNVDFFQIAGRLGTSGGGTVDGAVLEKKGYLGFVKRVYNAGDPSVNHLILVQKGGGINQTYSSTTYYDDHKINGLQNTSRIYYLLYAGSNGAYIDNTATEKIMDAFLKLIPSPDSLNPNPVSGLEIDQILNNEVSLSWVAASDDSSSEAVSAYDVRIDTIEITSTSIDTAPLFEHKLTPAEPGEKDTLEIGSLSEQQHYWVAIRTMDEWDNYSEPVYVDFTTLSSPEVSISPDSIDMTIAIGDTVQQSIFIKNQGGDSAGPLKYSLEVSVENNPEQFAFITSFDQGTIYKVDMLGSKINEFNIGGNPGDIVYSSTRNVLLVVDRNYNTFKVVNAETGDVIFVRNSTRIGKILVSEIDSRIYILEGYNNNTITVLDLTDYHLITTFTLASNSVRDAALSPDNSTLWVLSYNDLLEVDAASGSIIRTLNLSNRHYSILLSPDGRYAYLYNYSSALTRVDLNQGISSYVNFTSDITALAISPDGKTLYASNLYSSIVDVLDAKTLTLKFSIQTANGSIRFLRVSSDGNILYIVHRGYPDILELINIQSKETKDIFSCGYNSGGFDLASGKISFISLDPKSGIVESGQSEEISLIIDATNLGHRKYLAKIIVNNNDPETPQIEVPLIITAQDKTGPDFNIVFFQNPYLYNDLKIVVFSHEKLPTMPVIAVNDDTTALELSVQDSSNNIYKSSYLFKNSETVTFKVSGTDSLGNNSSAERLLNATKVDLAKAIVVKLDGDEAIVSLESNSFDDNTFVFLWQEEAKYANSKQGAIYHIGAGASLTKPAKISIAYNESNMTDFNPLHFTVFEKLENGQWESIASFVDKENKRVIAEIDDLGAYKIGYDLQTVSEEVQVIPTSYNLKQNFPNPFNPMTVIAYGLPRAEWVTIKVYDVLGRELKTLFDGPIEAGEHKIDFNASGFSSGVYFYKIEAGKFKQTKKMLLVQ
jgi:Secretion system C-terminal sorting domain/Cytochrome D1 heme domain